MSTAMEILATALLFSFIMCCVVSGLLQLFAWSRHSLRGAPASFRAMLDPAAFFDEIGVRQIQLARRLLIVGAVAYASYVFLAVVA